ncbi:hypothetical protein NBRC116594_27060 [Shimia sp. NS0008-38b]
MAEVSARNIAFPKYPQPGKTYLSFSGAHGYQVNYIAAGGKAWLWYPGNSRGVPEEYKQDVVRDTKALCWRHPSKSYNPVTKQSGGRFACQSLETARKTVVAELSGDPFQLATGKVPYPLKRCTAPDAFVFDRDRFGC